MPRFETAPFDPPVVIVAAAFTRMRTAMMHRMSAAPVVASIFIACLLTAPSTAQNDRQSLRHFGMQETTELSGNISFSSRTEVRNGNGGDAVTVFSLGSEIGYFVSDGFEIGFNPGVAFLPGYFGGLLPAGASVTSYEKGSITVLQLFATAAYHFNMGGGSVYPFLQVPFGFTSYSASDGDPSSGFSWGVKGGVKLIAVDHLLLNLYGQFLSLAFNAKGATGRNGCNDILFGSAVGGFF